MTNAGALVRSRPHEFASRLGRALVEIVIAVVVLSGSIVVGHDLKVWREWYADSNIAQP